MKSLTLLLVIFIATGMILRIEHPRGDVVPPVTDYREDSPAVCVSYPHALVRCGVALSEEFEAQRNDPLLREHYSEVGTVQPVVLTADEWDFASFRGDTGIVWTPTRILIRAGEHVLRDRAGNTIRARCGNRLSPTPRTPVAFVMPPQMEHETPEIVLVEPPLSIGWPGKPDDLLVPPLSPVPLLSVMPLPFSSVTLAPVMLSPVVITQPIPAPVSEVPEPQTWLLVSGAFLTLLIAGRVADVTTSSRYYTTHHFQITK